MKTAFKIMAFSLMLNIAAGIMLIALPFFDNNPQFSGGLTYDSTAGQDFNNAMGATINPQSDLQDAGEQSYRVLDLLNIGFLERLIQSIDNLFYGFINIMRNVFGPYLETEMRTFLFGPPVGVLKTMMTLVYIISALWMWTGKTINKEQ